MNSEHDHEPPEEFPESFRAFFESSATFQNPLDQWSGDDAPRFLPVHVFNLIRDLVLELQRDIAAGKYNYRMRPVHSEDGKVRLLINEADLLRLIEVSAARIYLTGTMTNKDSDVPF